MDLELDHFFMLTADPIKTGDALASMGLSESFSRDHKGQGTSNRRFEFSNGMFELLYIRDHEEAEQGAARGLMFTQRVKSSASPFGVVLTRKNISDTHMPFEGWTYQPDYFPSPKAFHIGGNSEKLEEPLCIYVPFIDPVSRKEEVGTFKTITKVKMYASINDVSETLQSLKNCDRFEFEKGEEHLVLMTLDKGRCGKSKDFRPDLPLIINW